MCIRDSNYDVDYMGVSWVRAGVSIGKGDVDFSKYDVLLCALDHQVCQFLNQFDEIPIKSICFLDGIPNMILEQFHRAEIFLKVLQMFDKVLSHGTSIPEMCKALDVNYSSVSHIFPFKFFLTLCFF